MEKQELKQALQAIVDAPARSLDDEQRQLVRDTVNELGIEFNFKTRCHDCYHDAAMLCLLELRKEETVAPEQDPRRYILKPGTDLYFGNVRVNEATMSDELGEWLIAHGFERKHFVKCE